MHLIAATEARFTLGPDGIVRSDTGGRAYRFWRRYLVQFSDVRVLARVTVTTSTSGFPVTGPGVEVIPLPGSTGWLGVLRLLRGGRLPIAEVCKQPNTAYLARVPGLVGSLLVSQLARERRPFGLEVVGDPYDVLSSGAGAKVVGPALRQLAYRQMRRQCASAAAVAYVTRSRLQERYPPKPSAFETSYSSVDLPDGAFVRGPRLASSSIPVLVAVGTQSQSYKGHDILLTAVAALVKRGVDVRVRLVGNGRLQPQLIRLAATLGITSRTTFVGQVPTGAAVWKEMDLGDVFVLPSRTEGLPRALIEAMARGMPCVASNVGGVDELLSSEDLCPPADPVALARLLEVVLGNATRRQRMAARNLETAHGYRESALSERRLSFYEALSRASHSTVVHEGDQGVER